MVNITYIVRNQAEREEQQSVENAGNKRLALPIRKGRAPKRKSVQQSAA